MTGLLCSLPAASPAGGAGALQYTRACVVVTAVAKDIRLLHLMPRIRAAKEAALAEIAAAAAPLGDGATGANGEEARAHTRCSLTTVHTHDALYDWHATYTPMCAAHAHVRFTLTGSQWL